MTQLEYDAAWLGDAPINGHSQVQLSDADSSGAEVSSQKGIWPRMLVFDDDVKDMIHQWIDNEIDNFNLEMGAMVEDWKRWQTLYWAEPATKERTFPFKRAANIVIPLAAIAVEAIHARLMNTLFSADPFWSVRARSKEWQDCAKPTERWLQSQVERGDTLKVFEFCDVTCLELTKLGTCVGKSGYERVTKKTKQFIGDKEQDLFVDVKNGATLGRVPLTNFIMRLSSTDPQDAGIVGEKHRFTWSQLKQMVQSGRMDEDELMKIKDRWVLSNQSLQPNDAEAQVNAVRDKIAHTEPIWHETFEVHELYFAFDVDKDGWDEEIVVDYHKDSGAFLSARYNWYDDLHRPYRICNYVPVEGIWTGIGICKMTEQFQNEVTTIRRQRLDNATLANMAQIILKKGMGYGPGESIFPGKMWFVDDPSKDIREFKLSEVYPSSMQNEAAVNRDSDKRTSVNDVILGLPQEGTPATATSDLTRLAEGNKRFDLVLKNYRRFMSLLGGDVVTNFQLFGDQQIHWEVLGEDGQFVEQLFMLPQSLIRRGAIIELTVTDSITNQTTEKAEWMQLFQVSSNYYAQVIQMAQLITQVSGDTTIMLMLAQKALISTDKLAENLFKVYKVPGAEQFSLLHGLIGPNGQLIAGQPQPQQQIGSGQVGNGQNQNQPGNGANNQGPPSSPPQLTLA